MHDSMKLFAAAGVALLCVSPASAQESGRLSAEYLKQATTLIHWPKGLEPRNVDVFLHNEGWIDAPPAVVWKNLVDASQWPTAGRCTRPASSLVKTLRKGKLPWENLHVRGPGSTSLALFPSGASWQAVCVMVAMKASGNTSSRIAEANYLAWTYGMRSSAGGCQLPLRIASFGQ